MTSSFFINFFKTSGPSSASLLNDIKKLYSLKKTGHCGTLDPIAEGVLVIAVNKATKLAQFVSQEKKEYRGIMKIGVTSASLDTETEIVHCDSVPELTDNMLREAEKHFSGSIEQIPPKYSAIKLNGRRAYEIARKGENFSLKSRTVQIYNISLKLENKNEVSFFVKCSAGTYIRSIVRDLGSFFKTGAVMTELTRTSVGLFSSENAATLEELSSMELFENNRVFVSADSFLAQKFPVLEISDADYFHMRNGRDINKVNIPFHEGINYLKYNNDPAFLIEQNCGKRKYRLFLGK